MLAVYDIEILPTVFFQAVDEKEKLLSSTTIFRKRTNTTQKSSEDTHKFNITTGNIENILTSKQLRNKPLSLIDDTDLTVPKHKYDLLLEQNKLKDQKISSLEGQVRILREKNEELSKVLGVVGSYEGDSFMETTKLNEVTNSLRDRKRVKK